ncbi:ADP-ribosyltransferase, partial [Streptomyces caeni]
YDPPSRHLPAGHTPGGTFDGTPTAYDHAPAPSGHAPTAYDHAPATTPHEAPTGTPHTGGHDVPSGGSHTPHGTGHDTPPAGHTDDASHGAGHDHHGEGHDGSGHTDGAAHTGDHAGAAHDGVDTATHDGTDSPGASGYPDTDVLGHDGAGEPFEYKPHMSHAEFNKLTDEQKHAVAAAELSDDTRPFADADEAIAYGREHWNDYVDNLDPVAQQSLRDYTGETFPSYHDINGYLREIKGYGPQPEVLHDIDQMDKVMSTRPVPDNIMVARGTDLGYLKLGSPAEMLGQTFPDKGYTSTSLGNHPVKTFEGKEAILRLRLPKGTPALWLEKVSHFDVTERELLLARGTRFKVTRVFMDAKGQWQVYGEVLPRL